VVPGEDAPGDDAPAEDAPGEDAPGDVAPGDAEEEEYAPPAPVPAPCICPVPVSVEVPVAANRESRHGVMMPAPVGMLPVSAWDVYWAPAGANSSGRSPAATAAWNLRSCLLNRGDAERCGLSGSLATGSARVFIRVVGVIGADVALASLVQH